MFIDPVSVYTGMVGNHVAGKAKAEPGCLYAQRLQGFFSSQFGTYAVRFQGVGGGLGLGIAEEVLDPFGGPAAFPDTDKPEGGKAPLRKKGKLLIGDVVQVCVVPAVFDGELVQPDQGVFGYHHHHGHPGLVGTEALEVSL